MSTGKAFRSCLLPLQDAGVGAVVTVKSVAPRKKRGASNVLTRTHIAKDLLRQDVPNQWLTGLDIGLPEATRNDLEHQ